LRERGESGRVGEDVDPDAAPAAAHDAPRLHARRCLRLPARIEPAERAVAASEGAVPEPVDLADAALELGDTGREDPDADRVAGGGEEGARRGGAPEPALADRVPVEGTIGPAVASDLDRVVPGRRQESEDRVVEDVPGGRIRGFAIVRVAAAEAVGVIGVDIHGARDADGVRAREDVA